MTSPDPDARDTVPAYMHWKPMPPRESSAHPGGEYDWSEFHGAFVTRRWLEANPVWRP